MKEFLLTAVIVTITVLGVFAQTPKYLDKEEILFVKCEQYRPNHHNTETIFRKGEICEDNFTGGSAMRAYNIDTKNFVKVFAYCIPYFAPFIFLKSSQTSSTLRHSRKVNCTKSDTHCGKSALLSDSNKQCLW